MFGILQDYLIQQLSTLAEKPTVVTSPLKSIHQEPIIGITIYVMLEEIVDSQQIIIHSFIVAQDLILEERLNVQTLVGTEKQRVTVQEDQ